MEKDAENSKLVPGTKNRKWGLRKSADPFTSVSERRQ